MSVLTKLSERPLFAAALVFLAYLSVFVGPGLLIEPSPEDHGVIGIASVIGQWKAQLGFSLFFIIIISSLGWWRKVSFTSGNQGGLKFLILPAIYLGILFFGAW